MSSATKKVSTTWSILIFLLMLVGCQVKKPTSSTSPSPERGPTFIGSSRCSECHTSEAEQWLDSQHHKAMQFPTEQTVLGDFENSEFDYFGFKTKFYRKGDEFWVTTDGPDGVSQNYKIEYTFGVEPLQQYLIKFPDGRLQALSICWDTKKEKWFHLHPDSKIDSGDPLHWTGPQYNWNFMCAECHSTGVKKGYDLETDTYHTTYEEINVSCESCHGPGSRHLDFLNGEALPNHGFLTDLKGRGPWHPQTAESPPRPTNPGRESDQLDTCARCHSRRALLHEPYIHGEKLGQTHALSILTDELYHSDGQIDEEVYVYGSFLQSKMYHAGVVCTDCHDPHTARTRAEGDSLCLSCHLPARYQTPEHSHHQKVSCVECHMPSKVYMINDPRRDHSFRIPRPDLSAETGSPNACSQCHQDKSLQWVQEAYTSWYGEGEPHFGTVFSKVQSGDQSAVPEVAAIAFDGSYPDIVRATALSLAPLPEAVTRALSDESALVRREAVRALQEAPPQIRLELLTPMALDPIREVRMEAGRLLADTGTQDSAAEKAIQEYRAGLEFNSDREESRLGLLELLANQGRFEEAEEELAAILERYPNSPRVFLNGADYYRVRGQEEKGRELLQLGISKLKGPETAALHHSLGLLLIRQKKYEESLPELEAAFRESPGEPQFALVFAVALDSLGETARAIEVLQLALKTQPANSSLKETLAAYRAKLRKPQADS